MARKLVENEFWTFKPPTPPKKLEGVYNFFVKNEKNQSCSKLPEMARKLVENYFWTFKSPPPPKINKFGGRTKICYQKWKKSKLFKNAWNGEKIGRKKVSDFLAPPPPQKKKNLGGRTILFFSNEKNHVVQNCLKWREN